MNICNNEGCTNQVAVKGQCRSCYKYQYDFGKLKIIQANRLKPIVQSDGCNWPISEYFEHESPDQ